MSKRSKAPPSKPWEARIPGTPPPNRIAFPHQRPPTTAGTSTGRFSSGSGSKSQGFWAGQVLRYSGPSLTSEPTLAERGVHTLWDLEMAGVRDEIARLGGAQGRAVYNMVVDALINKSFGLPTPNASTNQDDTMNIYMATTAERTANGFVHPSQHTLRTWAQASLLPTIEMPLQGVAWHSPKTQEPGGSHSTPGLTLRSTRVHGDLFFAIADGVDSPVQVQFRIPMAALITMLSRYQALSEKPGGYMMYLTEDGELRFPTGDETLAGGPAPSDSQES